MTPMQIETKLFPMVGKTFMYMNRNVKVLRFEVATETTRIVTDWRDIEFSNANAKVKLEEFLPVDESSDAVVVHEDEFERGGVMKIELPNLLINKQGGDLIAMLKRNVEMIESSPEGIAKAQAINEQVKSVIDIMKIEVESMKVAAYVHKVHS